MKCLHGLKTKKKQDSNVTREHYEAFDINSFSEMQQLGYDIVKSHFENDSSEKDPSVVPYNSWH